MTLLIFDWCILFTILVLRHNGDDDFKKLYATTISKLPFSRDVKMFKQLDVFQRTNWNNSEIVPVLLQNAILANIDPFVIQLQTHFDDMFTNGREILLTVKKWSSWDKDLETEVDGKELVEYVNEWLKQNTVGGRFNMSDATENIIRCEQVKIPVYDSNNNPIDARQFAKGLQKYFKAAPFNYEVKLMTRGLGEAILVLGEK